MREHAMKRTTNRFFSLSGLILTALFAVMLSACDLDFSTPRGGIDVSVQMVGLPESGSRASRDVGEDGDVASVSVVVFNSSGTNVGSGTLTRTEVGNPWTGTLTVTESGTLTYVGVAKNAAATQALYLGNGTETIAGPGRFRHHPHGDHG